jgi:hypothetical protein
MLEEAKIVAGGKGGATQLLEDVEQYVDEHPGALESATSKALKGLSKMFSPSHSDKRVQATTAPVDVLPAVDGAAATPEVPVVVEEPASGRQWFVNPWIMAGIATASAAVCTGVAVGVLCFARIQRVQMAREPLLAGGPKTSILSDAPSILPDGTVSV